MEPASRVAPRAQPGTPRTPPAGDTGAPCKPLVRATGAAVPDLLTAALICNADGCPPEAAMQACRLAEDYVDGCCAACWQCYLIWVHNGRPRDPYLLDRGGGMIG